MLTDGKALQVDRREGESIEQLLARFKRKCGREGVINEIKKREYYTAPSKRRKEKKEAAKERAEKIARRERRKNRD